MAARQRDVKVRILSEYYDAGSKAAERATRRLASLQMAAHAEDVRREQLKADAIIAANRRQMDSMEAVGRTSLRISAAIAVGLGLSAKAAMDWESAFAGVRKVVDGSPEQIAALEGELRGLAKVLPATHEEIAAVAEVAGQLGVARADIAAFTRTAIDMGETTNMAADEAATSMAQLSNIMGLAASDASRLGSTIVELGNNGASTERDIVSMALRIAGAGRTVGMTADQVLSVSSALASVGLEAEAGGSAISRVLIRIDQDVSSGAKTLETYARVSGMTVEDFKAQWGRDATGALTRFITGLGNMQKAGGDVNGTLNTLGFTEIRVSDALRRAALAGDLLTDSVQTGSRAWEENIALAEEASKRYQTTEARLEIARNKLNDAAIDVGGNVLPVFADAAERAGALAEGFGQLPEPVKQWVTQLGMAAFGLSAVVGGAALVIPKMKALKDTVDALNGGSSRLGKALGGTASFLTGPWGIAIAAATIGLGVYLEAQGRAAQMTQELSETLDQQTGALTENSLAWVEAQLTSTRNFGIRNNKSLIDAAEEMGISVELVTKAFLGNAQAAAEAKAAADAWGQAQSDGGLDSAAAGTMVRYFNNDIDEQIERLARAREIQAAKAEVDREGASAVQGSADATEAAANAQEIYNLALADGNQLVDYGAEAVADLARALEDLNGPALDAEAAESRFQESIDGVSEALNQQIDELARQYEQSGMSASAARARAEAEVAAADKLDLGTEAGRRNRAALRDLAEAAAARANAILELTGDEDRWRESLDAGRQSLHDAAIQLGMTEEAAWAYVDSVLAIPSEAAVQATFDAVVAEQQMTAFVNHWSGYNVPINATMNTDQALAAIQKVQQRAGAYVAKAAGGTLEFYAGGGMREQHVAQIAPAGVTRIWNEPETRGEGYIPLANDWRRPRAEATLGEIASRFGGAYLTKTDLLALAGAHSQPVAAGPSGPVELSDRSVEQLASAILAGARRVTTSALEQAGARAQYQGRG